jgi:hypothetical protein
MAASECRVKRLESFPPNHQACTESRFALAFLALGWITLFLTLSPFSPMLNPFLALKSQCQVQSVLLLYLSKV